MVSAINSVERWHRLRAIRKDMEVYKTRNLCFHVAAATCIRIGWYRKEGYNFGFKMIGWSFGEKRAAAIRLAVRSPSPHPQRREHLILNGFLKQYKNWIRHREEYVSYRREERDEIEVDDMSETDPMIAMLNDIACGLAPEYTSCETEGAGGSNSRSDANEEALRYFEILDDAQTKLYPGCKDFSKLSFIVELLHLKALNQWFDTSFDMLLQLLHRVLPSGAKLAESYYQARKLPDGRRAGLVTIVRIVLQVLSIVENGWQQSK
ncbi:hypothetical protein MRB53_005888 [Persea americana]|uniref:Uncharacterized protein n=1 Tax=Persea americana TaxID=3435 RepID=A0ACC2MEM9_PERAE|nr:hypothetical protein MRB53_005888 [Persea americana]